MIGFMPEFYPDEMVYSLLARYYQRSGALAYVHAARDLYAIPTIRPDMYFINPMREEAWERIILGSSPERLILEHTMFPAYARFLPVENRQRALQQMSRMEGKPYMMLKVTHRRQDRTRYMRYCPVCSERDRRQYGETYWHRSTQIQGIEVCPEHGCILRESELVVSADTPPVLVTAEEAIPQEPTAIRCENTIQLMLAHYVLKLFHSELDIGNNVAAGEFLHSRLHGTQYASLRGEQRNITLLQRDFADYYKALTGNTFTETWQLQKVFNGYRFNFVEICMMAMFLKIPVDDLAHMILPESSAQDRFDERVRELRDAGMKYPAIANALGASYNVVKPIGEGRYHKCSGKPRNQPGTGGRRQRDYGEIDRALLPKVKEMVDRFLSIDGERPIRVTLGAVERKLELPKKQIYKLPQCKAYIESHAESYEQYWARELVWASKRLLLEGRLNYTNLQKMINLYRSQFNQCLPFVERYTSNDRILYEQIQAVIRNK